MEILNVTSVENSYRFGDLKKIFHRHLGAISNEEASLFCRDTMVFNATLNVCCNNTLAVSFHHRPPEPAAVSSERFGVANLRVMFPGVCSTALS